MQAFFVELEKRPGLFVAQAVLLVVLAGTGGGMIGSVPRSRRAGGITLFVFALAVYPLILRYFTKGTMVGAVKG